MLTRHEISNQAPNIVYNLNPGTPMRNYFNTPSSFGFNTESSYSPRLVSARSNLSSISDIHPHHNNNYQNQHSLRVQAEQDNEGQYNERQQQGSYQIEDIYLGLANIKKNKTLAIVVSILEQKCLQLKLFALWRLCGGSIPKKNRDFLLILKNYLVKREKQSKIKAFYKINQHMKNQRIRQLKIIQLIANRLTDWRLKRIRQIFDDLKQFSVKISVQSGKKSEVPLKGGKVKKSRGVQILKLKLGFSLIKSVVNKKIYCAFLQIKYNIQGQIKPKRTNSSQQKLISAYSYKNMTKKLPMSSSFSYGGSKMARMPNRIGEYKPYSPQYLKGINNLTQIINFLVRKRLKALFALPKSKSNKIIEKDQKEKESVDNPEIITNILKHICWISSQQSIKLKEKEKKHYQQLKEKKIKLFFLNIKRKEKQQKKRYFNEWRTSAFIQKEHIMLRIKELERLKEMYIQNFK